MSGAEALFAERLRRAWQRSDQILGLLPPRALLSRPIGLRHPFLFYLGHLPAFAWNQVGRGALGLGPLSARLERLYARGIDPADAQSAQELSIVDWPSVEETLHYRDQVRQALLGCIPDVLAVAGDLLCERGRVLQLVIEHELMHQETLLYMFAECPSGLVVRPPEIAAPQAGDGRAAVSCLVPAGEAVLGARFSAIPFGWDNEFERTEVPVSACQIDSLPVRNRDWRDFLHRFPHRRELVPNCWIDDGAGLTVKTVFGPVPFELAAGWPVQVSGLQARHYCAAHGGRLPTEAELHHAAFGTPGGEVRAVAWSEAAEGEARGNFGFRHWFPIPVGHTPASRSAFGIEELVGNGWEWSQTPFAPLPGFRAWARTYPGYSADFFDGEHDVVFGASWATDEALLRPSFRNWYRRDYAYPFSSFRVVRDQS